MLGFVTDLRGHELEDGVPRFRHFTPVHEVIGKIDSSGWFDYEARLLTQRELLV